MGKDPSFAACTTTQERQYVKGLRLAQVYQQQQRKQLQQRSQAEARLEKKKRGAEDEMLPLLSVQTDEILEVQRAIENAQKAAEEWVSKQTNANKH